ncbi:MAG TPA: hypothetical protein ENJ14_04010 [Bacteroidetes bacterium]|nr:hypothetical protein [Bacteroidota bacterium]
MTTFHSVVLKCPQCGTLMSDFELMSYTVHHATSWSDGKNDTGMPGMQRVKICAVCHLPFWKDDATLPYDPDWDVADELGGALDIRDLLEPFDDGWQEFKIQYYNKLIEENFADDEDKEMYLRTQLLWAVNDLIRYHTGFRKPKNLRQLTDWVKRHKKRRQESDRRLKLFETYEQLFTKNLERLIFLYIKKGDVDLIYLADMYREKGDFKKAKMILSKYEEDKNKMFRKLKRKILIKSRFVFRLD